MACECGGKCGGGSELGRVVGRVPIDLSTIGSARPAIPADAQGLMVTWMADANNNMAGQLKIFIGDNSTWPWAQMNATVNPMAIACGPITNVTERGAYITIVNIGGAPLQGILLLEYTTEPLKRSSGS